MVDKQFEKYLSELDPNNLSKREQALRFMCLGDDENARRMFGEAADVHIYRSRFDVDGFRDEMRTNWKLLKGISEAQIHEAIYLSLAKRDPGLVRQHLAWAAENADIPEDEAENLLRYSSDEVAIAHLWRGYALLVEGRYEEACRLLGEVVPLFNLAKRTRGSVYQTLQYLLPKALVPLCEFKLHPTVENRQNAIDGLEEFVRSFKYDAEKLIAYLYYFHLKQNFPEAYEEGGAIAVPEVAGPAQHARRPAYTVPDDDTTGCVVIFEKGSGSLEVIGSADEFEEYLDKVKRLGNYPAIARLMETYVLDEAQEPEPLVDECNKLLSRSDIDPEVRRITEEIHTVATGALESEDKVILYFDSEIT